MLGLYLHVPFCASICNYCNFNRGLFEAGVKARYVRALAQEIASAGSGEPVDTIYFGGGTPSLLEPGEIQAVIDACRGAFDVRADVEITLETNPETSTPDRMAGFRAAGVNRVSFGVQSMKDAELARLGRIHSAARARDAVAEARDAGFDNVSIDLMMWLPGQDAAQWLENVVEAIGVDAEHLSLYILEVYPHLPLRQEMDRQGWIQQPDDAAADMYESAMSLLDAAGYEQYEISNVCRPGRESRHNLKYWTDGEWLGFGPGAHSTSRGVRWRNVASTEDYVRRISEDQPVVAERRRLTNEERLGDALFTGLRLSRGVDIDILSRRYGVDVWRRFGDRLARFMDAGILLRQDGHLRLTRPGMLLANEVMSVFV